MNYLKSFVIGSSWGAVIMFYATVFNINTNIRNYSDKQYAMIAPLYLGIMNMASLYLAQMFNLSLQQRLFLISIISIILVISFAKLTNVYNFTTNEWKTYYIGVVVHYLIVFNIIIYGLERLLSC